MSSGQSYPDQIRILQDLISDIDSLIKYLDEFASIYRKRVELVDSQGIMRDVSVPLLQTGLPSYERSVQASIDELNKMKITMNEHIEATLKPLEADARQREGGMGY